MAMNPQKMLMQMQQQMARVQEELETATVEGSSGGGVVKATVTGKQDLVMAAVNEALRASQQLAEQKMGAVTAGLRIPGLG